MKSLRWLWVALALIGLAFALKAGLVAFAGYTLLGVYLVSRYLAREWVANLSAERTATVVPLEVGGVLALAIKIENAGKVPVGWVLVEDMVPERALRPPTPRVKVEGKRVQVLTLPARGSRTLKLKYTFHARGYYPIGPLLAETGDVFGLHRRHRLLAPAVYQLVLPRVVPIPGYDFSSRRPVGEVRLANRLFEDPTRTAGVRPYQLGDPLQRVHWRATARTGELHSRVYEPTSLAGSTLLIDLHADSYPKRDEPRRSDLAVTAACSIAYALSVQNQQLGLASNGRDAAERIREEALQANVTGGEGLGTRTEARAAFEPPPESDRLRPVVVETRRGYDQFQTVREALARLEVNDGQRFAEMLMTVLPRCPRDATLIAILSAAPVETAVALGLARRQGFAVSALLVGHAPGSEEQVAAAGRLAAEGVRDIRFVAGEAELSALGERGAGPAEYGFAAALA